MRRLPTTWDRFWSMVNIPDGGSGCWPWIGPLSKGYGKLSWGGKTRAAHQIAYMLAIGPIPAGLEIDHVRAWGCVRKDCCNPMHLEAVTHAENVRRGMAGKVNNWNTRLTHCRNGHPFNESNGHRYKGWRVCRLCAAARNAKRYMAAEVTA